MAISSAQAAANIIQGHGASTQIASAAENYSTGDEIRALGDLAGALDSLATMAGKGIPPAQAL